MTSGPPRRVPSVDDAAALQSAYPRYLRDCHELADTTYLVKPIGLAALPACIDAAR